MVGSKKSSSNNLDKCTRLTKSAYDKIVSEIEWRIKVKKEYLKEELDLARQAGDERENDAFSLAFEDFKLNEERIFKLKEVLANSFVVDRTSLDIVELGSTVVLEKEDGTLVTLSVVTSHEVNGEVDRISDQSPLGSVVIGCKVGDLVLVETPKGVVNYIVKDIIS